MDEFYKTRMGRQFFEVTMPKIAAELEGLNAILFRIGQHLSENNYSKGTGGQGGERDSGKGMQGMTPPQAP